MSNGVNDMGCALDGDDVTMGAGTDQLTGGPRDDLLIVADGRDEAVRARRRPRPRGWDPFDSCDGGLNTDALRGGIQLASGRDDVVGIP